MAWSVVLLTLGTVLMMLLPTCAAEIELPHGGYRLPQKAGYMIVAPRVVRPKQVYRLDVTIYHLYQPTVVVHAALSRNNEQYAFQHAVFTETSSKVIELQVPENVLPGNHRLVVEGRLEKDSGEPIFRNETEITFVSKHISVFIQTDKPIYNSEETVSFRVVGVTPDTLKPVFGSITVYVLDAQGNVVRRWLQQQLNVGTFHGSFILAYPVQTGTWTLAVDAFGHRYEQNFEVVFFYQRRFEVNVTVPLTISNQDWGLVGSLYGEHMAGIPGTGNVTIKLWVKNQDGTFMDGELEVKMPSVTKEVPFEFPMRDITEKFGDVTDKELHLKGWFFDWHWQETQNGSARTRVVREGINVRIIGRHMRSFKPGHPITVHFAVERPDGSPYEGTNNRMVYVKVTHEGSRTNSPPLDKVIIPDDNIIRYDVIPNKDDKRVRISCWHSRGSKDTEEVIFYRYYSPKNLFIGITSSTESPEVGNYMVFTVRTNVFVDQVNYIIVSRGNILLGNQLRMTSHQKTFAVAISREMAPFARILVHVVFDGEVVTDGLSFFVRDSRLFQASVAVNTGKDFSGDTIELIGRGPPGSYMSFASLDYELYRRGMRNFIDEEKVIADLATYEGDSQGPYQHLWYYNDDRWDESVYLATPVGGLDTLQTFQLAGLYILSDMNFTGQSYIDRLMCNQSLGLARCPGGECYKINKTCDGTLDCQDGYDEIACPIAKRLLPARKPRDTEYLQHHIRFFNDHQWLWKTVYIMPVGRTEIQVEVPESMDPYVVTAIVLHPEEGLSIVRKQEYAMHDTTRMFFMGLEMPESTRRGEQIGVRCSLFNLQDERIEVILTLHGSDDYRFVNIEEYGYVSSYNPRTTAGDIQTMVLLESGEFRYVHFPVLPTIESGEVTLVISAYTFMDSDIEERTFEVRMDGVENGDYTPYLIDLVNQGSIIIPDFDINIPEVFIHPETRRHLYVPGSQASAVLVFGDVVTPGFFEDHLSSDVITGLPHDSCEGYMFDFAINLQTLKYLQATNALKSGQLETVLEYMKDILMRQYAYMEDDGSFKMFRRSALPCLWATAFVCRTLHEAMVSEWNEELYVETKLLNKVALWIARQQQSSGVFIETAETVYDRNMLPYTYDKNGTAYEWHIPLTAYVTITLASLTRVSGPAKTEADAARDKATAYLAEKMHYIDDPLQTSLIAYALHVSGHKDRDNALKRLHSIRRLEGDGIYWANAEIGPNPTFIVNTVHIMEARPDYDNLGNAVTATSYALLLYLQKNEEQWTEDSIAIMKWLQTQRMGMTVWSSTQDTLVAVQALAAFAVGEKNRFIYQMEVTVTSTFSPEFKAVYKINASNFESLFSDDIPVAHGQVKSYAKGTGYAMIQVDSTHNVEYPELQANPDYESYHVEVVQTNCLGRNCSIFDVKLCVRFARPDITTKTGMTIVQYEVPSGFVVARDTIEAMYRAGTPGLRRVRFRGGVLITFFEYILEQNTCFDCRLERWYPVANVSIQHMINAFEYAETGLQNNTLYTAYSLFHLHICQVCGSFQCPYCPSYNSAPGQQIILPLLLVALAFVSLLASQWPRMSLGIS